MTTIDPKTPVLVTGATGYVAGRLVERLLEQANQTPSVKRVVVTSSCAAIYGDNADLEKTPDGVFTEEIWNTSSSVEHQAYSYSKTLAEREAWEINQKQDRWDLVTINPTLVMGPGLNPHGTSESFNMMKQYGDGSLHRVRSQLGSRRPGYPAARALRHRLSLPRSHHAEMVGVVRRTLGQQGHDS